MKASANEGQIRSQCIAMPGLRPSVATRSAAHMARSVGVTGATPGTSSLIRIVLSQRSAIVPRLKVARSNALASPRFSQATFRALP